MIAIFSFPNDVHARSVEWGVRRHGREVAIIPTTDYPDRLAVSIAIGRVPGFEANGRWRVGLPGSPTAVWNRRFLRPSPPQNADPRDHALIVHSSQHLFRAMRAMVWPDAFWVNDATAQVLATNKLLQLSVAQKCGLRIPETLVTNDPSKLEQFCARHDTIAKPLIPMMWAGQGKAAVTYTARMAFDAISDRRAIENCPMIYQENIRKSAELRVVMMGREFFAFRIDGYASPEAAQDWRVAHSSQVQFAACPLSEDLQARLIAFADHLGLVFGVFDLIETGASDAVFLEVNEQGQFLFLEERVPEAPLLDAFCQFLMSGRKDYTYTQTPTPVRFADFSGSDEWQSELERIDAIHKPYEFGDVHEL